jgi:hypothetical protein
MKISIIITTDKYFDNIKESCLNQTLKPYEIIRGDYKTEANGNVLLFIDDVLPLDFLEKSLETFDKTTPFVYCTSGEFGKPSTHVYSWKTNYIWSKNFINSPLLMWKDAFVKAGGWDGSEWSLALRLSRLGMPRKSPAVFYRKEKGVTDDSIRRKIVNLTIGLIYSGRIKGFIDKWMETLKEDTEILNNLPQFIIVNNSEEKLDYLKKIWKEFFGEIKIITGSGKFTYKDDLERRRKLCEMLSDQYNIIIENSTGELIHLREDDIIANNGSFKRIYNLATEGSPVREAVAGVYLNRNINREKIKSTEPQKAKDPYIVDFTGTGFLIFWKELCPVFSPMLGNMPSQDWSWGMKLKSQGGKLWIDPNAVCKHYINEKEYVEYNPEITINTTNAFTKNLTQNNANFVRSIVVKKITPIVQDVKNKRI